MRLQKTELKRMRAAEGAEEEAVLHSEGDGDAAEEVLAADGGKPYSPHQAASEFPVWLERLFSVCF